MSYALVTDMQLRYPNRDLVQLTNEDPTVTTINAAFLQTFLDDASDEIDTYLEARFSLPLINPPNVLTRICCELAMYHLQALRPIHDLALVEKVYDKNVKELDEVANGQRTLGINTVGGQEPADPSTPAVVFVQAGGANPAGANGIGVGTALPGEDPVGYPPARVFSRGTLRWF